MERCSSSITLTTRLRELVTSYYINSITFWFLNISLSFLRTGSLSLFYKSVIDSKSCKSESKQMPPLFLIIDLQAVKNIFGSVSLLILSPKCLSKDVFFFLLIKITASP